MSLSAQELSFLNTVGPRPALNKVGLLQLVYDAYPEKGINAFEKKWLTKRKAKNEITVPAQKVQLQIAKRFFDGVPTFRKIDSNAWHTTYAPASKKIESFNYFRKKNDGVSLADVILDAIKESDFSQMFREDLPFSIQYEKDGLFFKVNQEVPGVDEYETSEQQQKRLLNIFNSYFLLWTIALDKYRDLLKNLKHMEESVGLDEKIKDKIINDYLDSLQTPSHAEQFKNKITLRDFVLKYA